jgi:tetratricopeptide (TPR) repeat protein
MNYQHLEANYLLGVAYMNKNEFVKSLKHFDVISNLKPDYSKNVYVLAAICCKKLSLYEQSQKRLTKCIELFPDNADAFLYRAKILLK